MAEEGLVLSEWERIKDQVAQIAADVRGMLGVITRFSDGTDARAAKTLQGPDGAPLREALADLRKAVEAIERRIAPD